MSCPLELHDFDPDGKCTHCDTLTGEAFWKLVANGLGMEAPNGAAGLRFRPGKPVEWIRDGSEEK